MSTDPEAPPPVGFAPGKHYQFDPPVETNCVSVAPGAAWTYKTFAGGWCLRYDERAGGFAFQGKPVGDKTEHFFIIAWGKGSVAQTVPPPRLSVVR